MNIVEFIYRGYEIIENDIVVTDKIWMDIFGEESPFEKYTKNQCESLLNFYEIDYKTYGVVYGKH